MARPSRLLWGAAYSIGVAESSWHINGAGAAAAITVLVPDFDLVVVVTAGLYASPLPYWVPTQWLNRHVLEAVRECSCLLVPKVAKLRKLSSSFGAPGHWRATAPFANYQCDRPDGSK